MFSSWGFYKRPHFKLFFKKKKKEKGMKALAGLRLKVTWEMIKIPTLNLQMRPRF